MRKNLCYILKVIFILLVSLNVSVLHAQKVDLVKYVNTLQGTNSRFELTRGNTYPTTALPFAMHTWTPQTGVNGDGWKYQYEKDSIRGFQQAHQCSSWTNDYAVFSLMPVVGKLVVDQFGRAAKFSHRNEIAKPHYYKVLLVFYRYNIKLLHFIRHFLGYIDTLKLVKPKGIIGKRNNPNLSLYTMSIHDFPYLQVLHH